MLIPLQESASKPGLGSLISLPCYPLELDISLLTEVLMIPIQFLCFFFFKNEKMKLLYLAITEKQSKD